jgi:hypothetical protein
MNTLADGADSKFGIQNYQYWAIRGNLVWRSGE